MSHPTRLNPFFGWITTGLLAFCLVACGVTPLSLTPTTPAPTRTITITSSPSAAPTAAIPALIQTDLPGKPAGQGWWQSPDGQWLVEDLNAFPPATKKDALRVVRTDGKMEWEVKLLTTALYPVHRPQAWSQDGNYVYIATSDIHPGGDLTRAYCRMNSIRRVDLRNGWLEPVLDFSPECWDAAFSPDGSLLAYVPPSKTVQQLVVLDLKSDKRWTYKLNSLYSKAGLIQWAPDRKQLLVAATRQSGAQSSLFWIKVENEALVDQEVFSLPGPIFPQEWQGDRVLVNQSADFKRSEPYWELSLGQKTAKAFGPTLTPTLTQTPSRTPRFVPSKTPGPNWATLLAPTETVPAIIQTEIPDRAPGDGWVHSPDGKWLALDYYMLTVKPSNLRIVRADGKVEWKIDFLGPNQYGLDRYSLAAWSHDGNFAYIAYTQVLRDGGMLQYCGLEGIRRLDLRDGSVTPFLEFNDSQSFKCWNHAFSADVRKLAYIPPTFPRQLVVMDLDSGKKLIYKLDSVYSGAGLIQWSADQKQLILVASQPDTTRTIRSITPPAKSTLFWVKIEGDELVVKEVFSEIDYLYPHEWKGNRVLVRQVDLAKENDSGPDEDPLYWEVDLSRGVALPVNATSTPRP
jgi:dipeptidyl aminopeptidase/acylaminoacyl peptidase